MTLLTHRPSETPIAVHPRGRGKYAEVLAAPLVPRLLAGTLVGRLPSAMAPVLVLLAEVHHHAELSTAGMMAALQGLAAALGQPLLARQADRHGHRRVLAWSTIATTMVFAALALTPRTLATTAVLVGLSGLLAPPLQACQRARWQQLLPESARETAVAIDTGTAEMVYITAPLLAAAAVYRTGPASGYLLAAVLGAAGTALVCTSPALPQPPAAVARDLLGPLKSSTLRWMLPVHLCIGAAIGTVPIAGLLIADRSGNSSAAGLVPALYACGSLFGGLLYSARRWPGTAPARFLTATALLSATWLPVLFCADPWTAGLAAVLPGAALTPTLTCGQYLTQQLVPGQQAEASAWLIAALGTGEAVGVSAAGHWPATWWPLVAAGLAAQTLAIAQVHLHRTAKALERTS
jgi:predicted MFS family arabinose efflux permease